MITIKLIHVVHSSDCMHAGVLLHIGSLSLEWNGLQLLGEHVNE